MEEIQKAKKDTGIEAVSIEILGKYLDTVGGSNLTTNEKEQFLQIAMLNKLNPFKREIYCAKYGDNLSIVTGFEVYLKRAERTGLLKGWSLKHEGSVKNGDLSATVTIHRSDWDFPFSWTALYTECVQKTREGNPTKFWQKASYMTGKCAISQGFRLCFSDELGGMPYTSDEMPTHDVTHEVVKTEIAPKTVEKPIEKAILILGFDDENFKTCLKAMQQGYTVADFRKKYQIQPEVAESLLCQHGEWIIEQRIASITADMPNTEISEIQSLCIYEKHVEMFTDKISKLLL